MQIAYHTFIERRDWSQEKIIGYHTVQWSHTLTPTPIHPHYSHKYCTLLAPAADQSNSSWNMRDISSHSLTMSSLPKIRFVSVFQQISMTKESNPFRYPLGMSLREMGHQYCTRSATVGSSCKSIFALRKHWNPDFKNVAGTLRPPDTRWTSGGIEGSQSQ